MQSMLHTEGHTERLASVIEAWGEMCWLMEDQLVPEAGLSIARMTINGDQTSPSHLHSNCNETIVLLSGVATCLMGGTPYRLNVGDVVFVPLGVAHAMRNDSAEVAIALLS
jgi:mannose-6-phosphate isomerase-like protein (cupin superfamily)